MSWSLLTTITLALGVALFAVWSRRTELRRMARSVKEREEAQRAGGSKALLQYPVIDLSRCLGCGTCVAVCPEEGVLELVHGQATVVNGARCVGVAACERECPVSAIKVTIADLATRTDVPIVDDGLEAVGQPGLFLGGEVTAHALVKTAIEHGAAIAAEVARRTMLWREQHPEGEASDPASEPRKILDLVIVGAGPAGLACALEAKRNELRAVVLEQEAELGGTVAKYPRRKLVMTLPVDLPLHGRLRRHTYSKEELIELWREVASEHRLPIRYSECFAGLEWNEAEQHFVVRTQKHIYRARHVCLAIGRRGVPNKLQVPGEDLPKVAYSLLDAQSYQGRRVLVVGGGDSAVETAVALAEQPGNDVTLSYRKERLFRIKSKNQKRLEAAIGEGRVRAIFNSDVVAIQPEAVELRVRGQSGSQSLRLSNDDVFVMAGGVPPVELLQSAGVSFDPALRPPAEAPGEQGTGLYRALVAGFALSLAAFAFAFWQGDYYLLPVALRATHPKHLVLRPGTAVGLTFGIAAVVLIACNLLYLLRRAPKVGWLKWGSLQLWMTSHVATGILALLCALLHGAMAPGDTPGGHAFWALVVLLVTGAVGRYFYAYVPRATNGRELELAEVKAKLSRVSEGWDQVQQRFRQRARQRVESLIEARQWRGTFGGRVLALLGVQLGLRRVVRETMQDGIGEGIPPEQLLETVQLTRQAHRTALMAAHYEDVRALLASWRYLHRWVAALMVLLVAVHVVHALAYGSWFEGGRLDAPGAVQPLGAGVGTGAGGDHDGPAAGPGAAPGGRR